MCLYITYPDQLLLWQEVETLELRCIQRQFVQVDELVQEFFVFLGQLLYVLIVKYQV